jgi:Tfp pilus assembly protein PilN
MSKTTKMDLTKKDMNFFSEFSSSAGQVSSYMSLILIVFIGLLVVAAGMYLVIALQSSSVNNKIDNLTNEMNNQAYADEVVMYNAYSAEIDRLNQKYYDITELLSRVSGKDKVQAQLMDTIEENTPEDVTITDFLYEKGSIQISGLCESTYSPLDMLARLSETRLFLYVNVNNISKIDPASVDMTPEEAQMMVPYEFSITGSFYSSYPVTIARFTDEVEPTPLSSVETQTFEVGSSYVLSDIQTYTAANGTTYTLKNVIINKVAVDPTKLADMMQGTPYSIRVSSAVDVELIYGIV